MGGQEVTIKKRLFLPLRGDKSEFKNNVELLGFYSCVVDKGQLKCCQDYLMYLYLHRQCYFASFHTFSMRNSQLLQHCKSVDTEFGKTQEIECL